MLKMLKKIIIIKQNHLEIKEIENKMINGAKITKITKRMIRIKIIMKLRNIIY